MALAFFLTPNNSSATTIEDSNISEPSTLKTMINDLKVIKTQDTNGKTLFTSKTNSLVVMDAGIASQENIDYLKEKGYEYLVVSRKKDKQFNESKACVVKEDKDNNTIVRVQKVEIKEEITNKDTKVSLDLSNDGNIQEIELYCHSKPREAKDDSMQNRVQTKFIKSLQYLKDGLTINRRMKRYDKVLQKIGALKSDNSTIAKYYDIAVKKDPNSPNAIDISWKEKIGTDDKSAMNGVYCLRTNNTTMNEKTLWKTYTTLTDLEAVFRTLKTELKLRPIYHKTPKRVDAHLFITTIAYTIIHTIRYKLKAKNINHSWSTIKDIIEQQVRITTIANCQDGKVL